MQTTMRGNGGSGQNQSTRFKMETKTTLKTNKVSKTRPTIKTLKAIKLFFHVSKHYFAYFHSAHQDT